jgi:hypothetical protein
VALISSAPSDVPADWFLTNEMMAQARATVNARLGGRRLLTHAIFTPGQPGWMEALERALVDLKPDSMKGYTIGDNTNKDQSRHPWRLDDEKLLYPAYEKMAKRASSTRASTRVSSRPRSNSGSRTCAPTATCATSGRRRRTGRSSTSSSTTGPIASRAGATPRTRWPSSSRAGAWSG